jgi:proline iminopeptidase
MTNIYTHETENHFYSILSILLFSNCQEKNKEDSVKANYLDFSKRDDQFTGGKMIPITTPKAPLKCGQNRG